jgi:hypothetical protein
VPDGEGGNKSRTGPLSAAVFPSADIELDLLLGEPALSLQAYLGPTQSRRHEDRLARSR